MKENKYRVIAIDGGAASGKSTTARGIADRLNFLYVDTGMHYRGITAQMLRKTVNPKDVERIEVEMGLMDLDTVIEGNEAILKINGVLQDPALLKKEEVTKNVSGYARLKPIREILSNYQRSLVELGEIKGFKGIVMEGRDIGSVVLPDADRKFYMEASLRIREERRLNEGKVDMIASRDKIDRARTNAPLRCADDAMVINTNHLSIDAVLDLIISNIKK